MHRALHSVLLCAEGGNLADLWDLSGRSLNFCIHDQQRERERDKGGGREGGEGREVESGERGERKCW